MPCYAMEKWGVDPEKMKLIEYDLLANPGSKFGIGRDETEHAKAYISGSITDMQSLLVDIDKNVPKDEDAFQGLKMNG